MPRPVEALPWGSMSITRVGSPTAARAVPRLIAVVVLPTPPFWLATTRMRGFLGCDMTGAQLSHGHYSTRWIGLAWDLREFHVPTFLCLGQFRTHILAFQEQANTVRSHEAVGIFQQLWQGSDGPGRDHVESPGRQVFHPGVLDCDREAHPLCCGLQKSAFLGGGLKQGHGEVWPHRRQDQPRKPGAGTQIGQVFGPRWDKGCQLSGIPEMPAP